MATLSDFLLARIAEDEAVAGSLPADGFYTDDRRVLEVPPFADGDSWPRRWSPTRVLAECEAECEAKRRAVAACVSYLAGRAGGLEGEVGCEAWDVLCALSLPYADHPDYPAEWRPS